MHWDVFLVLTAVIAVMMLFIQRTEPKRRRVVFIGMLFGAELVRRYVLYRGWPTEGFWAVIAALVLNLLFWIFYGRSNPPLSSEEQIEVLGNE